METFELLNGGQPPPQTTRAVPHHEHGPQLADPNPQYTDSNSVAEEAAHKWQRILRLFLNGTRLNRLEAVRLGDTCLNSTVAALEGRGVVIDRVEETVAGWRGQPTRLKRYWLERASSRDRACELLGLPARSDKGEE